MWLWRRTPDPNPHQPWWSNPDAKPNWRPPNGRPRFERLRNDLFEHFAEPGLYKNCRAELKLSKEGLRRFLDGDDNALSPEQTKTLRRYIDEFGRDMRTNKLIRRPRT